MTTVLVADDSATVRALVAAELEGAGYDVVEVGDGEQALAVVRAAEPPVDLVLLDVEMPVRDGFSTIAELKKDEATRDLPVVFLTSRDSGEDVVEALRLGAHDYLRKPPQAAELLARVGAAAEVSGLRQELRRRTQELALASRTDHLTGLLNRRALDGRLHELVASTRPHRYPMTVLLVDVDHFKSVNDQLGHDAGDAVLVEVAGRMAPACGATTSSADGAARSSSSSPSRSASRAARRSPSGSAAWSAAGRSATGPSRSASAGRRRSGPVRRSTTCCGRRTPTCTTRSARGATACA